MGTKTTKRARLRAIWENSPTVQNILKVSAGDIASKIVSVATVLLLIRGLSIADYAAFTSFSGISTLFSGLVGAGINMAIVRFSAQALSKGKERPIALYGFAIFFQIILYLAVAGLCLLFPAQSSIVLFGHPGFSEPLRLGLFAGLGILIVQFTRSLYQAEEKFTRYIGTLWLVQFVLFIILGVLWILGALSFASAAVTSVIVQLAIGLWLLRRHFKSLTVVSWSMQSEFEKSEVRQFMLSSGWLIGYFLTLSIIGRMDILMLARFSETEELARYGVAFQYYSLALLFLSSIHAVLLPKFSRAEMLAVERQSAFVKKWLRWSAGLIIPIGLFGWLGKPIFVLVSGTQYEDSFEILIILSIGIWFSMMFSPFVNIILGKGEYLFLFLLSAIALCANILLNLLLIPVFGGVGAAIVAVSSIGMINLLSFAKLRDVRL